MDDENSSPPAEEMESDPAEMPVAPSFTKPPDNDATFKPPLCGDKFKSSDGGDVNVKHGDDTKRANSPKPVLRTLSEFLPSSVSQILVKKCFLLKFRIRVANY